MVSASVWWVHTLSRSAGLFLPGGVTELFLNFRRLFTGPCLYRECMISSVCFIISCRDVVAILTPGGAIPAKRYTFSTEVGLKNPVIYRHASLRAGSSLPTCVDYSHTGHAYSAVEWQSASI